MKVQDSSGSVVHTSWGVGGTIREAQGVAARAMWLLFRQHQHNLPALAEAREDHILPLEKPEEGCMENSVTHTSGIYWPLKLNCPLFTCYF